MNYQHRTIAAVAALAGLAACATTPETLPQLEEARTRVETLAQDPLTQQAASRELVSARGTLQQAETALDQDEPIEEVTHLAYLAARQAEIGQARVEEARSREAITEAEAERNRVLLEQRSEDAAAARARAESAQQEARAAQLAAATQAEEAEAARRALEELKAEQTERGMVLTLGDVLFDVDAATLKPGAALTIDRLAQFLSENAETRVMIEGHTDSTGSDAYNQELSRQRAQAVADALAGRGIPASRVSVIGRGEGYPVAGNETAAGRQENRRVEIVFSDQEGRFNAAAPGAG
jgi:outer membrane protein OmpA-like peptidoglycan-associated protein